MVEVEVVFFKPSGKYYSSEKVLFPEVAPSNSLVIDVFQSALANCFSDRPRYRGMVAVAMMDELDYGYPQCFRVTYDGDHLRLISIAKPYSDD